VVPSRRFFATGLSAAALSVAAPSRARAQTSPVLRVLTVASDPGALPFYAQENGFFSRAALNVEVSTMGNGAAIMAAVAGDAAEVGNANAGTIAAGVLSGLPFTIIADGGLYQSKNPNTLMCVVPNSPIRGPKDFAGKKIALNGLRIVAHAAVAAWLDKNGTDSKSVGFIEMPFSTMLPLLESGRIDAAFIGEPVLSTVRARVRIIGAPNDMIAPEFSYASYMTRGDWVAKNRDLAGRFSAVLRQTAQWANANPQQAGRILAKYMKIDESVISTMARVQYAASVQVSHLQPSIDIMARYGFITKRIDANTLVTRV
jgi:NitT/TauT family transport system substrate-binding protein